MEPLSITVDLEKLVPVSCSPDFCLLLGFDNERSCLKSFSEIAHFQGHNFLQISQLGDTPDGRGDVPIIDKTLQIVGVVEEVRIDRLASCMQILARDNRRKGAERVQYLPAATLVLDRQLNILELDNCAATVLGGHILGSSFPEVVAPAGMRRRLSRIYRRRLDMYAQINIKHRTNTSRSGLDTGVWRVTLQPDRSFKAVFHAVDTLDHDFSDSFVFLQPARNRIVISPAWAHRLGIEEPIEESGYRAFLGAVFEEDREVVEKVLSSERIPDNHLLRYRLVSADGRVIAVDHRVEVLRRSGSGVISRGQLQESSLANLSAQSLKTLAIEFGLETDSNREVLVPDRRTLESILTLFEECLREEQVDPAIRLSADCGKGRCSVCDALTGSDNRSLVLVAPGYRPERHELRMLAERTYSLLKAGGHASWKSLFTMIHRAGFHTIVAREQRIGFMIKLVAAHD